MKRTSRLLALLFVVICCAVPAAMQSRSVTGPSDILVDQISDYATEQMASAYSGYYRILDAGAEFHDLIIEGEQYQADLLVSLECVLKAEDPRELPFIQGMLEEANVSVDTLGDAVTPEQVLRDDLNDNQKAAVAKQINFWLEEVGSGPGEAQNINFALRITGALREGQFDPGAATMLARSAADTSADTFVPVEEIFPATLDVLKNQGKEAIISVVKDS